MQAHALPRESKWLNLEHTPMDSVKTTEAKTKSARIRLQVNTQKERNTTVLIGLRAFIILKEKQGSFPLFLPLLNLIMDIFIVWYFILKFKIKYFLFFYYGYGWSQRKFITMNEVSTCKYFSEGIEFTFVIKLNFEFQFVYILCNILSYSKKCFICCRKSKVVEAKKLSQQEDLVTCYDFFFQS